MTPSQIINALQWLLITLAIVATGLMYHKQQATQLQLDHAIADNAALQQSADSLAKWLHEANASKFALQREGEMLAAQVQSVEQQKAALALRNQTLNHQLNQLLENAQDENTKAWLVGSVPDDVMRLYDSAAHCALRANLQDSVCVAARSADGGMPRNTGTSAATALPANASNVPEPSSAHKSRASGTDVLATH